MLGATVGSWGAVGGDRAWKIGARMISEVPKRRIGAEVLGATVGPFGAVLGAFFGAVLVEGRCLMPRLDQDFGVLLWVGAALTAISKPRLTTKREGITNQFGWGAQSNVGEACSDCEMKGEGQANMHAFLTKKHVDCRHLNLLQATTEKEQRTKISQNV